MCGPYIVIVLIIIVIKFDYTLLMLFEMYTILFLYIVINQGSSYERRGAVVYLIIFGYVIRFSVVISNNLILMRLILMILRIAKLPLYGLHMWLPKVHVEASIVGSIILARRVLKLRILYIWNFRWMMMVRVLLVYSLMYLVIVVDGKGFAAYSSVLHISLCVVVGLLVILLIGYIHIIISPLIFITIYKSYIDSRSRFYMKVRFRMIVLWIINFRLPFLRGFFSEVYIIIYSGIIIMSLMSIYMLCRYVMIKSINNNRGRRLFYIPFLVLYILII